MRLSSVVLLAVALLLGLGAVFLTMNWLEQQRSAPLPTASAPETKMRRVVVASQPLRFGTELTSINLKEVDWPSGAVPAGTFSTTTELTKSGERRVALAAIERDEPVLSWKVTGPGQRASLSAVLGSDKKAMTIRVNDVSGTAGFVLPGDRVDVLLTRTEDKTGYTDVLLQNVRALGIDQGEMNMQGFRYHNEILRRMKKPGGDDGRGADARGVKGLFKMSRAGQDRFQELLFPTKPQPPWQRALLGAIVAAAEKSDRWLAERAPAT